MTQKDFDSIFSELLGKPLPPPADPREIAMKIFRRDSRRTRILAGLSLFFWLIGTSGLLLLLWGLDRLIIFIRIEPGLPWNVGRPEMDQNWGSPEELMRWGTDPIHHCIPFIYCAIVSLMLAAVFTVLLVYSSRRATLNRINLSLQQISLQLKQSRESSDNSNKPGNA